MCLGGPPAGLPVIVGIEVLLPGGEPVQQLGGKFCVLPGDVAFVAPQWEIGTVIRRELDHLRKWLSAGKVVFAWMPPGVRAHGRSLFHCGAEEVRAVAAAEQEDEPLQFGEPGTLVVCHLTLDNPPLVDA
jgi:hypothetical protein